MFQTAESHNQWVREHYRFLLRSAWALTGSRAVAEDVVQDCFTSAWKHRTQLRQHERARARLFRIMRRSALRYVTPHSEPLDAPARPTWCWSTACPVDRPDDEASFTSYDPTVRGHANGYQVESFIPGGERVALSGTSMAAPQVIEIIVGSSEKTADGRRTLINPAKAVEAARSRK